jgi:hypothetical protein
MYFIQHCYICRPSDSTVSKDGGIEPMTVATLVLAFRPFQHFPSEGALKHAFSKEIRGKRYQFNF